MTSVTPLPTNTVTAISTTTEDTETNQHLQTETETRKAISLTEKNINKQENLNPNVFAFFVRFFLISHG